MIKTVIEIPESRKKLGQHLTRSLELTNTEKRLVWISIREPNDVRYSIRVDVDELEAAISGIQSVKTD
jgi:hypothetical protein